MHSQKWFRKYKNFFLTTGITLCKKKNLNEIYIRRKYVVQQRTAVQHRTAIEHTDSNMGRYCRGLHTNGHVGYNHKYIHIFFFFYSTKTFYACPRMVWILQPERVGRMKFGFSFSVQRKNKRD